MSDPTPHGQTAGIDPEYQYDAERGFAEAAPPRQPPGLWVLFITEMWERFSYYGMRALFVLYLTASTAPMLADGVRNTNPGFGWSNADAYTLYGVYTFMVYLTSIFGGIAADRLLGTHRSMLVGGWIIAAGHITLAAAEFFKIPEGQVVSMGNAAGSLMSFLVGCALIIIGTGFFKPCVSVMVGQLYSEGDARRDSGFTIFYMGINLGAFFSPLVAGYLGEKVGWHWGFGSAAVGMIVGLIFYQLYRGRYLGRIGAPPEEPLTGTSRSLVLIALLMLLAIPLVPLLLFASGGLGPVVNVWSRITSALGTWGTTAVFSAILVGSIAWFLSLQRPGERSKLAVIFILAFFGNIFFWSAFEQAGSSMTVFADDQTDRTLFGLWTDGGGFPAAWYQSVNPLGILLFAPVFSWLWIWLDRKNANPSTPMKFAIGLWLLGLAFLAMVFGAIDARDGLAGPHWLLITYVVVTWGELCLSPVGLSMVTKLSPSRLQSLMMGLWFFSLALSNLVAGLVARFSERFVGPEADMTFILPGLPGFFLLLVVFPIGMGVLIMLLSPMLKRMMGGVK
jgi:POT family proton-dependent oligopeptide transporter